MSPKLAPRTQFTVATANKALPLVVVCPTGARAGRAAGALRKLGYEKAQVLAGGLKAWRDASLPVEKTA